MEKYQFVFLNENEKVDVFNKRLYLIDDEIENGEEKVYQYD